MKVIGNSEARGEITFFMQASQGGTPSYQTVYKHQKYSKLVYFWVQINIKHCKIPNLHQKTVHKRVKMFSGGLISPSIFYFLLAYFLVHFSLFCSFFATFSASTCTFFAHSLFFSSVFFLSAFSLMKSIVSPLVSRSEGGLFGLSCFFFLV